MTPAMNRMRLGLVILAVIFLVAVCGYCLAGMSLLDSVYMVVITLSTVGYREVGDVPTSPQLQVFTIGVIVFGVSTALYTVGGLLQMMFEGEINRAVGRRRGLLIVAVRRAEGELEFNPDGDTAFEAGAAVGVMGRPDDIDRFRAE